MAGKGGGAWKVAYADFVTAMMAFFLVMWLVAQDQMIKENIAHYFVDPMGYQPIGKSGAQPADKGSVLEASILGSVPNSHSVAMGRGRQTTTDKMRSAYVTAMITDWLRTDDEALEYWLEQADKARSVATLSSPSSAKRDDIDAAAARQLADQLQQEVAKGMPKMEGLYRDLMEDAMMRVMWIEIAEDLLTN